MLRRTPHAKVTATTVVVYIKVLGQSPVSMKTTMEMTLLVAGYPCSDEEDNYNG